MIQPSADAFSSIGGLCSYYRTSAKCLVPPDDTLTRLLEKSRVGQRKTSCLFWNPFEKRPD